MTCANGALAFLSIKSPLLILFKSVVTTAICPLRTLVKIFRILSVGLLKQTVLVTSVVPNLYCPPESHKKISFFFIFLLVFLDDL